MTLLNLCLSLSNLQPETYPISQTGICGGHCIFSPPRLTFCYASAWYNRMGRFETEWEKDWTSMLNPCTPYDLLYQTPVADLELTFITEWSEQECHLGCWPLFCCLCVTKWKVIEKRWEKNKEFKGKPLYLQVWTHDGFFLLTQHYLIWSSQALL